MMGAVNVFICVAMFGSLLKPMLAQSVNSHFDTDAQHSAELPIYLQNPDVFSQTRIYPSMQRPQNVDKGFVFPYTYHSLDNVNLLPPDVELIPANLVSGGNKGPLIFPSVGGSESAPYVQWITNQYAAMPYPLHHLHHNHHHSRPHLGGHRPIRPVRPSYYPVHEPPVATSPPDFDHNSRPNFGGHRPIQPVHPSYYPVHEPPVATIPPDVEVFPHQKPSGNRPVRPMPTPRPWYPPAIPSYNRWIYEMRKSKQQVAGGKINSSLARSVSDSGNDTDTQSLSTAKAVFNQTAQPLNPYEEEAYQILPYRISNNHPEKLDESDAPLYVLVPLQPDETEVRIVNPHPKDESRELDRPLSESTTTGTLNSENKLDSTEQPTASSEHSQLELDPCDEDDDEADCIDLEEDFQTDVEDITLEPSKIDMAMLDIEKMEADIPEDGKLTAVEDTDDVTERVVEDRNDKSQKSDVDTVNSDSILDEMIKIGQKLDADSIYIEKVTEMEPESGDTEVSASARNRKFYQRASPK